MDGRPEMTDVKKILKQMSDELSKPIESYIEDELPANLIEAARQYPYAGGKRMRPAMVIAACRAVGGDGQKAVPLAVAIEYIHNFTLIHDDLMDGDEKRRGMTTSHVKYGMPTAVLAGDALFAKAFQIIADLDVDGETVKEILRVVSKSVWDLARGQQMDINNENGAEVTMDEYIETIRLKTSVLFAAGAAGGAMIGGASREVVDAVHGYAMNLGVAFQMYDDILGIVGDPAVTGKSSGNDIRKGKSTVIVCHALKNIADRADLLVFRDTLGKTDATDAEIDEVRSILRRACSLDYAIETAEGYINEAIDCLDALEPSEDKDFMIALAEYTMTRTL